MTENKEQDSNKGRLSLRPTGRVDLGRTVEAGSVRQSFSHGRSKVVQVEVRKKRGVPHPPAPGAAAAQGAGAAQPSSVAGGAQAAPAVADQRLGVTSPPRAGVAGRTLTQAELAARQRALAEQQREAARREAEAREREKIAILSAAEEARRREEEARKAAEEEAKRKAEEEEEARRKAKEEQRRKAEEAKQETKQVEGEAKARAASPAAKPSPQRATAAPRPATKPTPPPSPPKPTETLHLRPGRAAILEDEEEERSARRAGAAARKPSLAPAKKGLEEKRRVNKIDVLAALEGEDERVRSLASVRRQRERERRQAELERLRSDQVKVVREVVLPETITVQELANRIAVRAADVIKALMKLGVMATITQTIDADTAELVVQEFGHRVKRISEADVELGLEGAPDTEAELLPRPPVVTVMGHVDHGKTSLLDALRQTDVAAHEAGGITQHIGAYQVRLASGDRVTFIDTPGHEAFTAMRARGASVTDIVVLVVAADDGVMPQTVEAIRHAKAAGVPIIVAINKIDKPDANPNRVMQQLSEHGLVPEEWGGDTITVQISALQSLGIEDLLEQLVVLAEVLELRANPEGDARGVVLEANLDVGRGPVATVVVVRGTLRVGDPIVAGPSWGRVKALIHDRGEQVKEAPPSTPVQVLGLSEPPIAGDELRVTDDLSIARNIGEAREQRLRFASFVQASASASAAPGARLEDLFQQISRGETATLNLVLKADVQGSVEAVTESLRKLERDEVKIAF